MPANYEIRITGICLCFYKNDVWNVIFPCDTHHKAEFWYNGSPTELRKEGRAIVIEFPRDAISPSPATHIPSSTPLFNVSAGYAHGTTGGKSNLSLLDLATVADPAGTPRDFVWLKVPNAALSSQIESNCPYYVQDITDGPGLPLQVIHKVAREVVIHFTVEQDFRLTATDLRDSRYTDEPVGNTVFATSPNYHLIEIDNDCHGINCPKVNDFMHLYWIVEDISVKKILAAGQIKCSEATEAPTPFRRGARVSEKYQEGLTTPYGNCDPTESDPPPGP